MQSCTLKLRDQQLNTIVYILLVFKSLMVTTNQKLKLGTQKSNRNPNIILKVVLKSREDKRRRGKKALTKGTPKQ